MKKILFIDHYDSFSFNLIDWIGQYSGEYSIERIPFDRMKESFYDPFSGLYPLVLSPGPHEPGLIEPTLKLIDQSFGKLPILAVCLGHQAVLHTLGGKIVSCENPLHGSARRIKFNGQSKIYAANSTISVATYNSLCMTVESDYKDAITAYNDWNEIEACEFWDLSYACLSCQFHPESFMSHGVEPLAKAYIAEVQRFFATVNRASL